jgi:hypothetical protein
MTGDAPIPEGVQHQLRNALRSRIQEIGGLVGYSVNPATRSIFHYPTSICFQYADDMRSLKLLTPGHLIANVDLPLIEGGAHEALRMERERDSRIQFLPVDRTGRAVHKIQGLTEKLRFAGRLTTIIEQIRGGRRYELSSKPASAAGAPERYVIELIKDDGTEAFDISKEDYEHLAAVGNAAPHG